MSGPSLQNTVNRATRNFDIKSMRRILSEALPPSTLQEQYGKSGLLPSGIDPSAVSPTLLVQGLSNEFFKSESIRMRLAEALQSIASAEIADVALQTKESMVARMEAGELEPAGPWIWALGTSEVPAHQSLGQELARRKPGKPGIRKITAPEPPPPVQVIVATEPLTEDEGRTLYRKNRKLQGTLGSLQKEIEKLKQERSRGKVEADDLRVENDNLRKRVSQVEVADELRARLEQVEKEKEHVIYELNRKTHELYQLQRKYEIFNRLDTEVLILRSKVAKILNDAIVERKRFAAQLTAITESNLRSLDFYRDQKMKNLGPPDRTPGALRVGVFVDVQNMFYAARNKFNGRLDYQALLKTVVRGRRLAKANAYIIQTPDIDQSNFILLLEHCGYEVHSKYLRTRYDGSAKGDWDMEIAIDIISMIGQLDVVILVSGDGDFVALVKMVQRHGLEVEVHSFEHNTAVDLREAADRFYPINEDLILH